MFDHHVHAYLRAVTADRSHRIGPFQAAFDDYDAGLSRNYAIPDDDAHPTPGQVADLIAAFTKAGRVPRLEYLPGLCPAVEPALIDAGFIAERRLIVMTCAPSDAVAMPVTRAIEVRLATTDEQLRQVSEAQNDAYGRAVTTDHDVARLRGTIDGGGLVAMAVDMTTGFGVGGGLCAPPHEGFSELAAIGVRAAYRRRGIATALTVLLTRTCPSVGITSPFLTPAGEAIARIYLAVGYRPVTEMLQISVLA